MRDLYLAERRLLEVMSEAAWGIPVEFPDSVVAELLEPRDRRDSGLVFAQDYAVEFVERPLPSGEFVTTCQPVLPGVFGAEVFLTAEKTSMRPLILETMNANLLDDDAVLPWLRKVDGAVRDACRCSAPAENGGSTGGSPPVFESAVHDQSDLTVPIEYARIAVVRGNICFLLHSHKWLESSCRKSARVSVSGEIDVWCHVSEGKCVALDGWVKTLDERGDVKRTLV